MERPVNAVQDVQQVQLLPHAEAEVVEQQPHHAVAVARQRHHLAVTADVVHRQADAEAALADAVHKVVAVQQKVVADHQLAMLRRPLWFLNNSLK